MGKLAHQHEIAGVVIVGEGKGEEVCRRLATVANWGCRVLRGGGEPVGFRLHLTCILAMYCTVQ